MRRRRRREVKVVMEMRVQGNKMENNNHNNNNNRLIIDTQSERVPREREKGEEEEEGQQVSIQDCQSLCLSTKSLPFRCNRYANHRFHHQMLTSKHLPMSTTATTKSSRPRGPAAAAYMIFNSIFKLSIYSTILLLAHNLTGSEAHSYIDSVWLSKDDASPTSNQQHQRSNPPTTNNLHNNHHHLQIMTSANNNNNNHHHQQQQQLPGASNQNLTTTTTAAAPATRLAESSGESWMPTSLVNSSSNSRFLTGKIENSINNLQALPSSLYPAIVDLESDYNSNSSSNENRRESERRMGPMANTVDRAGGGSLDSPMRFNITGAYGAFTNEASSLDHLWSLNQTNNAQVQFDEEHMNNDRPPSSLASINNNNDDNNNENNVNGQPKMNPMVGGSAKHTDNPDRRQDNDTAHEHHHQGASTEQPNSDAASVSSGGSGDGLSYMDNAGRRNKDQAESSKSSQHQVNYLMGNVLNVDQQEADQLKRNLMAALNMSLNSDSNNDNNIINNNENPSSSSSHNNNNNNNRSSFIYYMPDANNKWNPTGNSKSDHHNKPNDDPNSSDATTVANNQEGQQQQISSGLTGRRKLHNSGTQYDLKELERVLMASQKRFNSNAKREQQASTNNRMDFLGPTGFSGASGGHSDKQPVEATSGGGGGGAKFGGAHQAMVGSEMNGMEEDSSHRDNFPSYFYTGGAGIEQVLGSNSGHPRGSSSDGHLNDDQDDWKRRRRLAVDKGQISYGFTPQTSDLPVTTETSFRQRTTPMPTTFAAATTLTPAQTVHPTSPMPTPVPLTTDSFHKIAANFGPHLANTRRFATSHSMVPLKPRLVKHPPSSNGGRPNPFGLYGPGGGGGGGGDMFADNRRDTSAGLAWKQRSPSPSKRLHQSSLVLGQRPHPLLTGYSPYGGAYGFNGVLNRYKSPTNTGRNTNKEQPKQAKKSILGSLGSKLNSWVDPNHQGREQKLEESFYGTGSHQHRRRVKPPANWGAPNNLYYLHAPAAALMDPAHLIAGNPAQSPSSIASQLYPGGETRHQNFAPISNYYHHPSYLGYYATQPKTITGNHHNLYQPMMATAVRQPTVAPAPSSLDRYFFSSAGEPSHHLRSGPNPKLFDSHLTQSSHHLSHYVPNRTPMGSPDGGGGQQPASFIPVVAVSVTKTSPAPARPLTSLNQAMNDDIDQQPPNEPLNSELIDYLEMKTGDGNRAGYRNNRNSNNNRLNGNTRSQYHRDNNNNDINMVRVNQFDDYGNLASGTVSRDSSLQRTPMGSDTIYNSNGGYGSKFPTARPQPQSGEQTTTVKSAIFGYLPHEADKPLLQAINMLPSSSSLHHNQVPRAHLHPTVAAAAAASAATMGDDSYGNRLTDHTSHSQAAGGRGGMGPMWNSHLDHIPSRSGHDASLMAAVPDEPLSLGLQLQANNFAQNDIAHPFAAPPDDDDHHHHHHHHSASSPRSKPSYTGGLQSLLQQQQQVGGPRFKQHPVGPLRPLDVYPANQHQYHGFQLLQPSETNFVSPHHLNPLLNTGGDPNGGGTIRHHQPAILTAAATELNPLMPAAVMFAASPAYALHSAPATTGNEDNQQSGSDEDESAVDQSGSPANKGNKKRSGDFFASAGQLLLSALPLLLAPTLGLMFASSPLPVARYQAPNTFGGGSAGSMQSSIPGEYLNSLNNDGQVSNSIVPQMFTPSPPGYNLTSTSRPSSGSRQHNKQFAMAASKQMPSILASQNKTTPTPQKLTVTLTTLGPPVFVNETEPSLPSADDLPPHQEEPSNSKAHQSIDHHHHHHHVGNTILLLTDEDIDKSQLDGLNATDIKSLTANQTNDIGGYEGVDYDAQFANLKKHAAHPNGGRHKNHQPSSSISTATSDNSTRGDYLDTRAQARPAQKVGMGMGDKSPPIRHQYSEPTAESNLELPERASGGGQLASAHNRPTEVDDDASMKLYPVSTWPPMRRRTVSLVTSNGNKTLLDASEKYQTIDYYTSQAQQQHSNNKGDISKGINYTTTFDDSMGEQPEFGHGGGYNSSSANSRGSSVARKVLGNPISQGSEDDSGFPEQDSKYQHGALDFMFSDGLSTVSLTREPLASRLSKITNNNNATQSNRTITIRNKRAAIDDNNNRIGHDNNNNNNINDNLTHTKTTSTSRTILVAGRPVRVVKRFKRFRSPSGSSAVAPNVTSVVVAAAAADIDDNRRDAKRKIPEVGVANASSSLIESASSMDVSSSAASKLEEIDSLNNNNISHPETMKSKSAHIVATMIARLDDDDELAKPQHPADGYYQHQQQQQQHPQLLQSPDSSRDHEVDELRDLLLRKKALLTHISGNSSGIGKARQSFERGRTDARLAAPLPNRSSGMLHQQQEHDESRQRRFNGDDYHSLSSGSDAASGYGYGAGSGGRGHIPPTPIEVTPLIKIKLYGNNQSSSRGGESGNRNNVRQESDYAKTTPSRLAMNEDMSEETRRAMAANFDNNLMIKDGRVRDGPAAGEGDDLGVGGGPRMGIGRFDTKVRNELGPPPSDNSNRNRYPARASASSGQRIRSDKNYETPLDGIATERSFMRATASPDGVSFNPDDNEPDAIMRDVFPNDRPGRVGSGGNLQQHRHHSARGFEDFEEPPAARQAVTRRGTRGQADHRADGDYYYNYNDNNRNRIDDNDARPPPTRAPAYHHVRDRVNLFDGDSSSPNDDIRPSRGDDYNNGHGYLGGSQISERDGGGRYQPLDADRSTSSNYHRGANRTNRWSDEVRSDNYNSTTGQRDHRRSEPSSPGGVHQFGSSSGGAGGNGSNSRSDTSLHHPNGGYVYDLRNNPPDPLPQSYSSAGPTPAPSRDAQSYHPFHNATTYAPNLYVPNHNPNNNKQLPHYYNQYHHQEENYPSNSVPNGHNRPQPDNQYPNHHVSGASSLPYASQYNQAPPLPPIVHPQQQYHPKYNQQDVRYPAPSDIYQREMYQTGNQVKYPTHRDTYQTDPSPYQSRHPSSSVQSHSGGPLVMSSSQERGDSRPTGDYLKRVQFSDSDRDKLMASYLTCDGLLNDNDHCLERLSCEFSDPQNIEKANKLDRAVSSILLGHILINTYIPNQFKLRLKSASLFGYTNSGKCSRFVCNKLSRPNHPPGTTA